jgi:transcriptional regulator with XRE-family HTH domain
MKDGRPPEHGWLGHEAGAPTTFDLGLAIRRCRASTGMSQETVSMHAEKTDRSYLAVVERGKTNIIWAKLRDIGQTLGTTLSSIATEAELIATGQSSDGSPWRGTRAPADWTPPTGAALGHAVRELRASQVMTSVAVCRAARLSRGTVQMIESGKREPTWLVLIDLAAVLACTPSALIAAAEVT